MDRLLVMLKTDLGITTSAYDVRLQDYLQAAQVEIVREGVTDLSACAIGDAQLIVMYAAWMWRRRDSMDGMPRMLRYALNNRIFALKMGEASV